MKATSETDSLAAGDTVVGAPRRLLRFEGAILVVGALGLIWLAHIGVDRLLGYGLKYDDHFQHTHLSQPRRA